MRERTLDLLELQNIPADRQQMNCGGQWHWLVGQVACRLCRSTIPLVSNMDLVRAIAAKGDVLDGGMFYRGGGCTRALLQTPLHRRSQSTRFSPFSIIFFRFSPSPFLMFLNPAFFVAGAASAAHFPPLTLPEVFLSSLSPCSFTHLSRSSWQVFYFPDEEKLYTKRSKGRANVGKSSLLNAVLGRKSLLRISKKAVRS